METAAATICAVSTSESAARSYTQVLRNGAVEAAATRLADRGEQIIPSTALEEQVIVAVQRYMALQARLGVDRPTTVMLSLIGVAGYRPGTDQRFYEEPTPIDRPNLIIPDVTLVDGVTDVANALRSVFDTVCQACGLDGSPHYDRDGRRIES